MINNVLPLGFNDFKSVCDEYEKRIYYYQSGDIIDLYFISEGMLIWTRVDITTVPNRDTFFEQKMFAGAIKLKFRIPVMDENSVIKETQPISIIEEEETEEQKNENIQKKGIESELVEGD